MRKKTWLNQKGWIFGLVLVMMLQLAVASYFCMRKQGFHYDEYYSYYSSNVTYGLIPTDREWKDREEIWSEFVVLPKEGFNYGRVRLMQTYDVHPPLYYFLLHTVCSLFPGIFSKWTGLGLNLLFFVLAYWLFARISFALFEGNRRMTLGSCLLFGFQPGILSGITFIRMYMLLLVWCLLVTCWHIPVWKAEVRPSLKRSAGLLLTVAAGFLTHYYFAVFLFFLAAFTCLHSWWIKKDLRESISYGVCVCLGMLLAILLYPSSLSHIFRGYRGAEATEAFFQLSNTFMRLDFFIDLMDRSVFGGSFLLLLLLLTAAAVRSFLKKKKEENRDLPLPKEYSHTAYFCLLTVTLGYFAVVAKTALLNAEEANRYQLPVYGFWLLLIVGAFYKILQKGEGKKNFLFLFSVFGIILVCQLALLGRGEVQFLYEEDRENVEWALYNQEETVVYLYNPSNLWMIWDEAEELMQFERIYFVSLAETTPIKEEEILKANRVYVYSSRLEAGEEIMDKLIRDSDKLTEKKKVRDLLYCDLYCLE